jgi:hypothetical protein
LSTIFVAAPFLAVLLERAPEYKGRRSTNETEALRAELDGRAAAPAVPALPVEVEEEEEEEAPVAAGTAAAPPPPGQVPSAAAASKRERRRQRRRARPHGRAR